MSSVTAHGRGVLEGALRALTALSLLLLLLAIGPRTGLYRPVTVLSDSMVPMFSRGDLVISTTVPLSRLRVGHVVSFRIPVGDHRVESHRVIEIVSGGSEPMVLTKGDANEGPDPWNAQLTGDRTWVVTYTVPELGWVILQMRNPQLRLLALLLAPALLVLRLLLRIWLCRAACACAPACTCAGRAATPRSSDHSDEGEIVGAPGQ